MIKYSFQKNLENENETTKPKFGKFEVSDLDEMSEFDLSTLDNLETQFYKENFPERIELEEEHNFKQNIDTICGKVSKQFNKLEEMEISKFANTCQNLITQHLTSSKTNVSSSSLYKNHLLSSVVETLVSEKMIESSFLELWLNNYLYKSKEIIGACTVKINKQKMSEKYPGTHAFSSIMRGSKGDADPHNSTLDTSNASNNTSMVQSLSSSYWTDTSLTHDKFPNLEDGKLGYSSGELEEMFGFVRSIFFAKYEQANYENIRKPEKFCNAVSNFIDQTLESKKFRKRYESPAESGMLKEWVSNLDLYPTNTFCYFVWIINFIDFLIKSCH